MGLKIALDTQISEAVAFNLKAIGHSVIHADHHEPDKAFFTRAEVFGAELYVSPDYDWMNHALDRGLAFLHLQQGWGMSRVLKEIFKAIKKRSKL